MIKHMLNSRLTLYMFDLEYLVAIGWYRSERLAHLFHSIT